jgi:hypothetical protein
MTNFTDEQYDTYFNNLKNRFPNAQFTISCFSIEEGNDFDNQILCDDDCILYRDKYYINKEIFEDFYLIRKKEGKQHIFYADVIDELIRQQFTRNETDHRYLESIKLDSKPRNPNSIPIYSSYWGS